MRQDLSLLLNNVAKKSSSLIGNFKRVKMLNHCNRGAWHTRCYAGALRFNIGPNWSPNVWAQTTETTSGLYFDKLYKQREQCIDNNKSKDKKKNKERRWKRKMSSLKESNSNKAKQHYGNESIQPESDISENELTKLKYKFLQNNIEITTSEIIQNEKDTKSQVCSEKWKNERKKRQTASNFGNVFKRKPSIKVTPLVLQLLYSNFKGNKATRIGLREERITIQEYINIKAKDNIEIKVEPCGLIIDKKFKYLAASPDGKVIDKENNEIGLIEIKNLVHDKNLTLTQAATSLKNFCLEKVSFGTNTTLRLKTTITTFTSVRHCYTYVTLHGLILS
ncbi:unnamed protein product [Mytilus edulis]|uniref:YqaJ viral recombinase domain-containing protein n=1 Tax=Mytilus edulis TaxID=6550 RepID=A0A8S3V0B3_MYTED|nr:unnamed protein product [Mytilus edulis]